MTTRVIAGFALLIVAGVVAWFLFSDQGTNPDLPSIVPPAAAGKPAALEVAATPAPALRPESRIRPRPLPEGSDGPTEPAPPVTGELVLTVVDPKGQPIAGALVTPSSELNWYGGMQRHTKADGVAHVGLTDDSTHLVVTAPGHVPLLAPIADRGRMRVVLGGDVTLRGRVVVDGAAPASPVRLTVRGGYDDPTDTWPERLRGVVRGHGFGESRLIVDTDAKGEFAARGPAPGSPVTIAIPAGYVFADPAISTERREKEAIAGGDPVVLELKARNAITGRVTGSDFDAAEAPDTIHTIGAPEVEIRYVLDQPLNPVTGSVRARIGERFAIYFAGTLAGVDLEVWSTRWDHGKLVGRKIRERIVRSKDLGDLAIEPPPAVVFRVLDATGAPIEKARVYAEGHVSDPTDAAGRTKLGILPGTHQVIAGAPRFAIRSFPLPEKLPETVDLRLEPSVTLVVRVRHEDPTVPFTGQVTMSFDVEESILPSMGNSRFNDARGATPSGGGGSGTRQSRSYAVRPGEDVAVSGFRSGDVVEVQVTDGYRNVLLQESITLPADTTHAIEMVVKSLPKTIRGTVLDHFGKPLAGAQVGLVGTWIGPWSPRTDASGGFRFENVYAGSPSLSVSAPGHVPKTITVDKPGEALTITLERARQVAVTVTGSQAGPFDGSVFFEDENGALHHANRRGDNLFWFEALPCRPGLVRALGSGPNPTSVPIGAEETKVTLPRPE